jgi:ABC-type sugar transport system ATPase subunit
MIALHDVWLRAGAFEVQRVTFHVPTGGYAVLMGRTGAGKTTILEAICGLNRPLSGKIELMDRDVTGLRPADREVGYVPQDKALFRTMTVAEHLAFGPTIRRWKQPAIDARVEELADLLGIRHLLHRKPFGLSGGEAQRVALGRALAARPGVLLLDEPLSALDDQTREEMYALLHSVRQHTGVTTLHVTHHLEEAERLADLALILENGVVLNLPPSELRERTRRVGAVDRITGFPVQTGEGKMYQ